MANGSREDPGFNSSNLALARQTKSGREICVRATYLPYILRFYEFNSFVDLIVNFRVGTGSISIVVLHAV